MPIRNNSKSQFKGLEAKQIADKFNIRADMIHDEARSYTVPSSKNSTKVKKITIDDIKWFIDQLYYHYYGKYKFNIKNIKIEERYDTDLIKYSKVEFINYYGIDEYLIHWESAPDYLIIDVDYSLD